MIKIYEVGTFEKYEEGFHAFYRSQDKGKAFNALEVAREYLGKIPLLDFNCSDEELKSHTELCLQLDSDFREAIQIKNFSLSIHSGGLYTIEIRDFETND